MLVRRHLDSAELLFEQVDRSRREQPEIARFDGAGKHVGRAREEQDDVTRLLGLGEQFRKVWKIDEQEALRAGEIFGQQPIAAE